MISPNVKKMCKNHLATASPLAFFPSLPLNSHLPPKNSHESLPAIGKGTHPSPPIINSFTPPPPLPRNPFSKSLFCKKSLKTTTKNVPNKNIRKSTR